MIIKVNSISLFGLDTRKVEVETKILPGLNKISIVGLPDRSINESRERVVSSFLESGLDFPIGHIIVNLSPAGIEKSGSSFDFPIAISILLAAKYGEQYKNKISKRSQNFKWLLNTAFIGELNLNGDVIGNSQDIVKVSSLSDLGINSCFISANLDIPEPILNNYILFGISNLKDMEKIVASRFPQNNFNELSNDSFLSKYSLKSKPNIPPSSAGTKYDQAATQRVFLPENTISRSDLSRYKNSHNTIYDISKTSDFKDSSESSTNLLFASRPSLLRIMTIAAAGRHNLIFSGPPGAGKTTLASLLPKLLPSLPLHAAVETYKLHALCGSVSFDEYLFPIFRSPHHTSSDIAIIGGGSVPKPGEISLAHNGVLFLDEISEFKKTTLDSLRQPIVDHKINISRAKYNVSFPADFQLLATRNPCPCSWHDENSSKCKCTSKVVQHYTNRVSGAIWDRFDLKIRVDNLIDIKKVSLLKACQIVDEAKKSIVESRASQENRYKDIDSMSLLLTNSRYSNSQDYKILHLNNESRKLLKNLVGDRNVSLRSAFTIAKVSRTIADLANSEDIKEEHVYEAILLSGTSAL